MTDPTVEEIQNDVNTRIAAFGEEIATELASGAVEQMMDGFTASEQKQYNRKIWNELITPALAWHTLAALARILQSQSEGWANVFFTNLREKYAADVPRPDPEGNPQ